MQTPEPTSPHEKPWLPGAAVLALAVFGATLAAYWPALRGGLLWDDAAHITARSLRGWAGLGKIWFHLGSTQQYYPVLHSAFWVEHRLWGGSVLGYHLVNVGLHAAAACLFAVALARLRGAPGAPGWPEWLAAAVFALHPVCVESVAWISEQKNTLSLVFYLLSALAYLRFDRGRGRGSYALALGLFLLALLSKSVTATLPGALLLAVAWRRPSLSWRRDVVPLVPWFVVGLCAGLFTAWVERTYIGARGGAYDLGLARRCFLAGRIVWFYLGKLVWPADLVFIYPRWSVAADWAWSAGAIGVAAVMAALVAVRRTCRAPLFAMLFFLGSVFPALGFFNVYPFIFSYVADHWQYLACLGIIALFAEGAGAAAGSALRGAAGLRGRVARGAFAGAAGALLVVLFVLTRRQCDLYRDVGVLYSDTLSKDPGCWMAHNNLGVHLMEEGSLDAAISHLKEAVRLKPDYSEAHNNLGNALAKVPARLPEAIAEFEAALRLEPGMTEARANLGLALVRTPGGLTEGIAQLQAALQGNADDPSGFEARYNLGNALARLGRFPEAEAQYRAALRLNPESSETRVNLGSILVQLGRRPEAVEQYRAALRIDPGSQAAHFDLGRALRNVDGREAVGEYLEALRIGPDSAEIRSSLGSAYYRQGRLDEAVAQLRKAVELAPGYADAHYNLGLALLREGREEEAAAEFSASGRPRP